MEHAIVQLFPKNIIQPKLLSRRAILTNKSEWENESECTSFKRFLGGDNWGIFSEPSIIGMYATCDSRKRSVLHAIQGEWH
jgi:hypothetical protein